MKLYDFSLAPSPRRVRMFLAEKGLDVPVVEINTRERAQFSDDYAKINPYNAVVPTLELDDGTRIAESGAICRYIEETHPEPSLMGHTAIEKAIIEMWNRRAEIDGYLMGADAFRNAVPAFEDRGLPGVKSGVPQIPALIERGQNAVARFYGKVDAQLADNQFLAGDNFSVADITLYVTAEFAKFGKIEIPDSCPNLARWHAETASRPSAQA
jgi:glutathione S-transferase